MEQDTIIDTKIDRQKNKLWIEVRFLLEVQYFVVVGL